MAYKSNAVLDTKGLLCPEPVMMLHNAIRDGSAGDIIELIATDPSTQRDIPKFCGFLGHQLLEQAQQGGEYRYWIKKGPGGVTLCPLFSEVYRLGRRWRPALRGLLL